MAGTILADAYELKSNEVFNGNFGGSNYVYRIPKYQRPYVWGKDQWRALFDDIVDNDAGYFVGALLCVQIRPATPNIYGEYEVIDGQQRLTTMSLLLAAIYKVIDNYGADNLSKKQKNLFEQIEVQLAVEDGNGDTLLRVFPQKDQQNRDDYIYIMGSGKDDFLNFISIDMTPPANMGNRRICKAYRFFKSAVSKYARDSSPKDQAKQLNTVFDVLAKVNAATFVRILSPTRASANKLFEALNNRGVPLTITDLIKNQLLSKFTNDTEANKKWREAVEIFSRNNEEIPAGEQERFFRQTHNAYRYSWDKPIKLTVAKRANLYEEYEKMTESPGGAEKLLKQLLESSRLYNQIQGYAPDEVTKELQSLYEDLRRINGATSYVLLLYLLKNRDELNIGDDDLKKILRLLIAFFVRHSFTNNPPSNALERIFNRFIEEVAVGLKDKDGNSIAGPYTGGKTIFEKLNERLKKEYLSYSGGNDNFESVLRGDVYDGTGSDDNIRFVLVKLAEKHLSGKTQVKFWEKKYPDTSDKPKKKRTRLQIPTDDSSDIPDNAQKGRDRPIWSIEHILPQTLTQEWIDELGCQNEADAKVIQEEHVHKLGNLTLTKYNSEMKNLSFMKKRDLTDKKNIFIGYKDSPLKEGLNSYIVAQDVWTPKQINERTELLIKEILEIFAW